LLVIALLRSVSLTGTDGADAVDGSKLRAIRVKPADLRPVELSAPRVGKGVFDLTAGETTSIAARELATGGPQDFDLLLPVVLPNSDALPARIVSMDGSRELKLPDAVVAAGRDRVRVRVESGWLSPGRYRIELESTERIRPPVLEIR
jgi:hypothetical protein